MAHDISEVMVNGRKIAEAMYANRPAWHNLGTVFDADGAQAPDSETAIALAHLDWPVEKESIFTADGAEIPNNFALVRQDNRAPLSVVGNDYRVLQNRGAFSFLDSLLQDGIMRYESAFALKGGRCICLLARMPSADFITREDSIMRYILLSAWHGGGAVQMTPTAVRVVCANTQRLALETSNSIVSIRHSGDLAAKLSIARRYLSQCDAAFTEYAQSAQSLLRGFTDAQAKAYIAELFPSPDADSKRAKSNYESKLAEVRRAFRSAAQNLPTVRGTWWALFNAVTEYVDHGAQGRQSRDELARRENRFLSVTSGDGAAFKDKALALALSMAA